LELPALALSVQESSTMRSRRKRTIWLSVLLACAATLVVASPATAIGTVTVTRSFASQGETPFVVPKNVNSVEVDAIGAAGVGGHAGSGAEVNGTLPVHEGETLYVEVDVGGGATNGGGFSSVALCSSASVDCGPDLSNLPWYLAQPIVAAGGGGGGGNLGGIGSSSKGGAGGLLGAAGEPGASLGGPTAGNGGGASLTGTCLEGGEGVGGGGDGTAGLSTPFRGIGGSGGEGNLPGGGGGGGYLGGCGGGASSAFPDGGGAGGGGASFANVPGTTDYLSQLPTVGGATSDIPTASGTGSVTISFQDSNRPTPSVVSPAGDEQVGARPLIEGRASHEADDDLDVILNVEAADTRREPFTPIHEEVKAEANGSFLYSFPPSAGLPSGRYKASVTQSLIGGGNETTGLLVTFRVDSVPPLISLTSPSPGAYLNAPPDLIGVGGTEPKDVPGVQIFIRSGGPSGPEVATMSGPVGVDGAFSIPFEGPLSDGTYWVEAFQSDNGAGTGIAETSFVLDTVAPQVALGSPTPGESVSGVPAFRGTAGIASGDLPTVAVDLYTGAAVAGVPIQTVTTTPNPDGSFNVPAASAPDPGTYTAVATQADRAGNEGRSASVTFTVPSPAGPPSPQPSGGESPVPAPLPNSPSPEPMAVVLGKPTGGRGAVHLRIECRSGGPACDVTITGVAVPKASRKKVTVAHERVSIPAGKREKLTVPLDGRGRRLLQERGRLRLTLMLARRSQSWSVLVRTPHSRRHRHA
jgi:hypothetical protein